MNATFLHRFKAFIIDYLLIFIYLIVLVIVTAFLFPSIQNLFTSSPIKAQFFGFLMVTLPVLLYFIISDSKLIGQSFGKRKTGIRVVTVNLQTLSLRQAVLRAVLKFLPWELSHYLVYRLVGLEDSQISIYDYFIIGIIYALVFTYIMTAIFTKKKQSLYDLIAKTEVIKVSQQ